MAILSMAEIYTVAGRAGFTGRQRIIASAIAMAESSGRTDVVNYLGCVGLWQIYQRVHQPRYPHWTRSWLQNPNNNAQAAWFLSNGGRNWRPWEVYTNGMYRRHLSAAENAARTGGKSTAVITTGNKWVNPLAGTITSGYGPRWGSFHSGTDIAPTAGQRRIGAAYAGRVIRTRSGSYKGDRRNGALTGRTGNGVVIDHSPYGQPYWTYYGHLSTPSVVVGQTVGAGQAIGIVGNTGNVVGANGTHLHFEVMNAGNPNNPFNPVPFMAARGANLGSGPSKAVYNPVYPDGILTPGQQLQASPWQFTFRFRLPSLANMKPVKIHPTQQGL